jgi:hypothetical protein
MSLLLMECVALVFRDAHPEDVYAAWYNKVTADRVRERLTGVRKEEVVKEMEFKEGDTETDAETATYRGAGSDKRTLRLQQVVDARSERVVVTTSIVGKSALSSSSIKLTGD